MYDQFIYKPKTWDVQQATTAVNRIKTAGEGRIKAKIDAEKGLIFVSIVLMSNKQS